MAKVDERWLMSDKEKLEKTEFLLRNYQITDYSSASNLIAELWWIVVEGKYKPEEGEDDNN